MVTGVYNMNIKGGGGKRYYNDLFVGICLSIGGSGHLEKV
jgi:hypothetical protein